MGTTNIVRLTVAEERHLLDLCICADRPQPETAALLRLGYAEAGHGKWGQWARITSKGLAYAHTLPHALKLEADWIDRHMNSVKRTDSGTTGLAARSPSKDGEISSMPASKAKTRLPSPGRVTPRTSPPAPSKQRRA
jgi:hypothetical protein